MHSPIAYFITALLYAALASFAWRANLRLAGSAGTAKPARLPLQMLVPLVWALHGTLLFSSVFSSEGINLGVGNALSLVLWLMVAIYWLASFHYRLAAVNRLVLAATAVTVLIPLVLPAGKLLTYDVAAFKWHLVVSMLAYSLLTIAALHAVVMLLQEKRLHHPDALATWSGLPPLMAMESLLFRILWAGFILLTATVASGIFFSEELFGKAFDLQKHKTVFALISWLIFAALLAGRQIYGWRGRTAARLVIAGFIALFLAYFGSKFVLEVILRR
ncbi:MAG: cytochrome c biogenesis protein CcsA [Burkholderiales bacterium]